MEGVVPTGSELRIFPDAAAASLALAEETAAELRQASGRPWVVALPTGNTPQDLYQAWTRLHAQGGLSFASARCFQLDEFWPAPSGAGFADCLREQLFSRVDLPVNAGDRLDGAAPDPDAECARYEQRIRDAGGLELAILGLAPNGHVAFNEPGSAPDSRARRVRLAAETRARLAAMRPEWGSCAEGLTLGIGTLLEARRLVVLAFGAAKAAAVERALLGAESAAFPATFLRRHPRVAWLLDGAAVARLTPGATGTLGA